MLAGLRQPTREQVRHHLYWRRTTWFLPEAASKGPKLDGGGTFRKVRRMAKSKTASDVACTMSEAGKETAGKPSVLFVFREVATRPRRYGAAEPDRCGH